MTKIVVTIDWRTAAAGWPGGQLYLLDLEKHEVLDHFVGSVRHEGLDQPGGWSGFRGVFCLGPHAYVADVNSFRLFNLSGDKIAYKHGWSTRRYYDIHDTCMEGGETIQWWATATNTDEVVRFTPAGGFLLEATKTIDVGVYLTTVYPESSSADKYDKFHINSVALHGADLWCLANNIGHIVRFTEGKDPGIHPYYRTGSHSIRVTPEGFIVILDTLREEVIVLEQESSTPVRVIQTKGSRVAEFTSPETGKHAKSGWLRGCAILDNDHLVCGTSPAQLFVVNYKTGVVDDYWWIEKNDVRASTFGIAVVGSQVPEEKESC